MAPKFSVLIPLTRIDCVQSALGSLKNQTFKDFEIVVSDNSQSNADWRNGIFFEQDVRVTVHAERLDVISNWNSLIDEAKGEWLVFLCDDDTAVPNWLECISQAILSNNKTEIISFGFATHYPDEPHIIADLRGTVLTTPYSMESTQNDPRKILWRMFDSGTGFYRIKKEVPHFPLAAVKSQLISKSLAKNDKKLFRGWCPMLSGAIATLAHTNQKVLYLNKPLIILGHPANSASAINHDNETFKRMHKKRQITFAPLADDENFSNLCADTMLETQACLNQDLSTYDINWQSYFKACVDEILKEKRHKRSIRKLIDVLNAAKNKTTPLDFLRLFFLTVARLLISWGSCFQKKSIQTEPLRAKTVLEASILISGVLSVSGQMSSTLHSNKSLDGSK